MADNYDIDGGVLNGPTITAAKLGAPFYYDVEIMNKFTSVTLHANTVKDSQSGEWVMAKENIDADGYLQKPLARAPLAEDYQVAVSNTWSQFGDDEIGKMWNNIKPFAPYVSHLAEAAGTMLDKMGEMKLSEDKATNSTIFEGLSKVVSEVKSWSEKGAKVLNRSLIAQGARFSYYSGTGVGFGNLSMKFTVFSGYVQDYEDSRTYRWMTVDDQLKDLYPYVMGHYSQGVVNSNGEIEGTADKNGENIKTGITGDAGALINEYFAWELPPAGYEADTKNIDTLLKGTLKLRFGAFYSLPNLLCTSAQFNFSKQMVKHWEDGKNKLSPVYCDVVLTFQPATKFSDSVLLSFISGKSAAAQDNIKNAKIKLKSGLDIARESNKNFLGGN